MICNICGKKIENSLANEAYCVKCLNKMSHLTEGVDVEKVSFKTIFSNLTESARAFDVRVNSNNSFVTRTFQPKHKVTLEDVELKVLDKDAKLVINNEDDITVTICTDDDPTADLDTLETTLDNSCSDDCIDYDDINEEINSIVAKHVDAISDDTTEAVIEDVKNEVFKYLYSSKLLVSEAALEGIYAEIETAMKLAIEAYPDITVYEKRNFFESLNESAFDEQEEMDKEECNLRLNALLKKSNELYQSEKGEGIDDAVIMKDIDKKFGRELNSILSRCYLDQEKYNYVIDNYRKELANISKGFEGQINFFETGTIKESKTLKEDNEKGLIAKYEELGYEEVESEDLYDVTNYYVNHDYKSYDYYEQDAPQFEYEEDVVAKVVIMCTDDSKYVVIDTNVGEVSEFNTEHDAFTYFEEILDEYKKEEGQYYIDETPDDIRERELNYEPDYEDDYFDESVIKEVKNAILSEGLNDIDFKMLIGLCKQLGIKTLGDLQRFKDEHPDQSLVKALCSYRKQLGKVDVKESIDIDSDFAYFQVDMEDQYGGTRSVIVHATNVQEAKDKAIERFSNWWVKAVWASHKGYVDKAKYDGMYVESKLTESVYQVRIPTNIVDDHFGIHSWKDYRDLEKRLGVSLSVQGNNVFFGSTDLPKIKELRDKNWKDAKVEELDSWINFASNHYIGDYIKESRREVNMNKWYKKAIEGKNAIKNESLRAWDQEDIDNQNALAAIVKDIKELLKSANMTYRKIDYDVFELGSIIEISGVKDVFATIDLLEDEYPFQIEFEKDRKVISIDTMEEAEDEEGRFYKRVNRNYIDESVDTNNLYDVSFVGNGVTQANLVRATSEKDAEEKIKAHWAKKNRDYKIVSVRKANNVDSDLKKGKPIIESIDSPKVVYYEAINGANLGKILSKGFTGPIFAHSERSNCRAYSNNNIIAIDISGLKIYECPEQQNIIAAEVAHKPDYDAIGYPSITGNGRSYHIWNVDKISTDKLKDMSDSLEEAVTPQSKYTAEDVKRMAEEIKRWCEKHYAEETKIYYLGKSYKIDAKFDVYADDDKDMYKVRGWKELNYDEPAEYFSYIRKPNILSMSFEDSLYDIFNGSDSFSVKAEQEFSDILEKYGLYYELGNAWNLSVFEINDYDWKGFKY